MQELYFMWEVLLLDQVESWLTALASSDQESAKRESEAVTAAIDLLAESGPTLGRPLVDRLKGSRIHNLKELRPSSTSIRVLFVFDPARNAVLLVAGDKAGNWGGWYAANIPIAEERYETWLESNSNKG
jgi:hypothetical protein